MKIYRYIITAVLLLTLLPYSHAQAALKTDFEEAVKLLQAKDYSQAEKAFTDLLTKATDDGLKKYCYIYRSMAYNGLANYKSSIADMNKAIAIDPKDLASYTDRAKAKAFAKDLNGARQDFLFILTKDTTGKQAQTAFYFLGKIAYQQNYFEQSVLYYDKYVALDSTDAEVYFNRGAAKDMLMDAAGSISDYTRAIHYKPNYMEAYANRGVAKINLLSKKGNVIPAKNQTIDACADLKRAKQLGDDTVDDMIFIHCTSK
ncbi:MAG: hypothetical protein KAY50_10335 [Chitinophagaceae bacterium]|nr:hypothetical protein [Chitinophagaceae bacterium]